MTLIDELKVVLDRLALGGWSTLFEAMEINLASDNLSEALLKPIAAVASLRSVEGFEEVSLDAVRPIEPGKPAMSLLYHALSSPAVQSAPDGTQFTDFPTPADLDLIENYVYAAASLALEDLRARFPNENLAICVFAREYRQRRGTVHGRHADMIYTRTGVARVGTEEAAWDGSTRSYLPRVPGDNPHVFRVMPCRYGVYVAVQRTGNADDFGPYKFDRAIVARQRFGIPIQSDTPDKDRTFWVPVHKLFSGTECLRDRSLEIGFETKHVNEKLRRIHLSNMGVRPGLLSNSSFESGFELPELDLPPFTIVDGLASLLPEVLHGPGVVCPVVRPRLVEPAEFGGSPIGANVPPDSSAWGSFNIPVLANAAHEAPEWMHVRSRLKTDGTVQSLNEFEDVARLVDEGRVGNVSPYKALHYSDFSGDGWVAPNVTGLPGTLSRRVPSYSLVAAPDFYPFVSQSALMDWWLNDLPSALGAGIWSTPPLTLCDQRTAPNLDLRRHGAPFVPEDETVSAMLGSTGSVGSSAVGSSRQINRTSYLPDNAAGLYAPGWDTSIDYDDVEGINFLASHGLGSPFPEDAKLCAALSAYWPSVAPDTSRSYGQHSGGNWRLVAPMTDGEVGLEAAPAWDGIVGPREVQVNGQAHIEDDDFAHIDYVDTALDGTFSMAETMKVDQEEYQARIVAVRRMLNATVEGGGTNGLLTHRLLSFKKLAQGDQDIADSEAASGLMLSQGVFRFVMVETGASRPLARDPANSKRWLRRRKIEERLTLLVDDIGQIVYRSENATWQSAVGV